MAENKETDDLFVKASFYDGQLAKQLTDVIAASGTAVKVMDSLSRGGFRLAKPNHIFGDKNRLTARAALMPGFYAVFGAAGQGKSTTLRYLDSIFLAEKASNGNRFFIALKGGEPETSAYMSPVDLTASLLDAIAHPEVKVITVDSLARMLDYDLKNPKDEDNKRTKYTHGTYFSSKTGNEALKKLLNESVDPVVNSLTRSYDNLRPANNTKVTGIAGSFIHIMLALNGVCSRLGKYCFAIINAGLSDSEDFRSLVTGITAGSIQLESTDNSLVRIIPIIDDSNKEAFVNSLSSSSPIVPFGRGALLNNFRIAQGAPGDASTMLGELQVPGTVTDAMIGGGDV